MPKKAIHCRLVAGGWGKCITFSPPKSCAQMAASRSSSAFNGSNADRNRRCLPRRSANTSQCHHTHRLRNTNATPTNNSRNYSLRLLVRARALVHLPITGFDPKTRTVGLTHPAMRRGIHPPEGKQPDIATLFALAPGMVAALHGQRHGRFLLAVTLGDLVFVPTTLLAIQKPTRASGRLRCRGLATTRDRRHQERCASRLQIAEDRHLIEAPVQQQVTNRKFCLGNQLPQAFDHIGQGFLVADASQGQGVALAVPDGIGGGVGVEAARALACLAMVDPRGRAFFAVVGDEGQVDGYGKASAFGSSAVGRQTSGGGPEQAVEPLLQLAVVGELAGEGVVQGVGAGGSAQEATDMGQGETPGSGVENHAEQHSGRTKPLDGLEFQLVLEKIGGVSLQLTVGQDIVSRAHRFLPSERFGRHKSF